MNGRREELGRRFARLVTRIVVARPGLWRVFRRPLRAEFERLAPVWDGIVEPERLAPLAAALDRLEADPASVLDLGTGTGKAARLAAERFPDAEVVGVDLAPRMIEQARALLPPELDGRVRFDVADASKLPFQDGAFDLVVLLNMIPFFDELARVTAPERNGPCSLPSPGRARRSGRRPRPSVPVSSRTASIASTRSRSGWAPRSWRDGQSPVRIRSNGVRGTVAPARTSFFAVGTTRCARAGQCWI